MRMSSPPLNLVSPTPYYVVQTQHGRELFARDSLLGAGFDPYLPLYQREVRHARRTTLQPRPLFPQYLFVRTPKYQDWRPINSVRGVVRLLCSTVQQPIPVPASVIVEIQGRTGTDGYVQLSTPPDFEPGDPVRVTEGAFTGFVGLFQRDDGGRVAVLLSIFGRDTPAVLPRHAVEAA